MDAHYLNRADAADFLNEHGFPCTKFSLQKYATVGGGPVYRIFGNRALYMPADLMAWAEAKLSAPRRSTSEAA
jgi:hypothetical protein